MPRPRAQSRLVPAPIVVAGEELDLLVPAEPEALLSDEAFEHEEYLPYWAELWPSAPALAEAVATHLDAAPDPGDRPRGGVGLGGADGPTRVLELGCGIGLPALVAARRGARVTGTDWAPDALELLERNAERVGAELELRRLDWFAPDGAWPGGPPRPWPLVLAADVLYEARNGPALLRVLDLVVAPDGEAWITDPGRPPAARFWRAASGAGWIVDVLGDEQAGQPTVRRLRRRG